MNSGRGDPRCTSEVSSPIALATMSAVTLCLVVEQAGGARPISALPS
jgi:hypothetical protein